jgi:hypothetical protein
MMRARAFPVSKVRPGRGRPAEDVAPDDAGAAAERLLAEGLPKVTFDKVAVSPHDCLSRPIRWLLAASLNSIGSYRWVLPFRRELLISRIREPGVKATIT